MFRILVIEDEEIERQALVRLLKERFSHSLEVYHASNGIEGLQNYYKYKPTIVLSDINIPGMNGLKLLAKIKEDNAQTSCIVLTSYNYFEYAHEAIKLGVENFLLKPIQDDTLCNSIQQVLDTIRHKANNDTQASQLVSKMEAMKPILESDCIQGIVENSTSEELKRVFRLLNIIPKDGFAIVLKNVKGIKSVALRYIKEIRELGYYCMKDNYYGYLIIFVLSVKAIDEDERMQMEVNLNRFFRNHKSVGIGTIAKSVDEYHQSFLIAIQQMGNAITLKASTQQVDVNEVFDVKRFCETLVHDFVKLDAATIKEKIDSFYMQIIYYDAHALVQVLKDFQTILICTVNKEFNAKITIDDLDCPITIHETTLYSNVNKQLQMLVENLFFMTRNDISSHTLVRKAVAYISLRYTNTITLSQVASYLDVTPFYLSRLLSTHLHKTFTDLVTELRIEKSKKLLSEDKKIKEIAYALGFKSQNYFTKVFKKVTGITPMEYKQKV
ncbi:MULTISPECIES: response regulator [unclassified Breznakia]|uniref:response regulator transcription factor n=1 Tax=unclassified Breznakia TaxID=2623764 RepID=UPI0024753D11|nr:MULTISPECIES: response regulator [unclassified Breznakia]